MGGSGGRRMIVPSADTANERRVCEINLVVDRDAFNQLLRQCIAVLRGF